MRRLLLFAAVMGIVLGSALVAEPSPASADEQCVKHDEGKPSKRADVACVDADHKSLMVCDLEEGNRVEAWVWWPSGPLAFTDENGSKPPCSDYKLPRGAHRLAICEDNEGCVPGRGKYVEV
jgi:hypothetical protein